jgi:hypothetical protein
LVALHRHSQEGLRSVALGSPAASAAPAWDSTAKGPAPPRLEEQGPAAACPPLSGPAPACRLRSQQGPAPALISLPCGPQPAGLCRAPWLPAAGLCPACERSGTGSCSTRRAARAAAPPRLTRAAAPADERHGQLGSCCSSRRAAAMGRAAPRGRVHQVIEPGLNSLHRRHHGPFQSVQHTPGPIHSPGPHLIRPTAAEYHSGVADAAYGDDGLEPSLHQCCC